MLACRGRQLTTAQESKVLKASAQCPLPLYIILLMADVQDWHSYDLNMWENLPPDSPEGMLFIYSTRMHKKFYALTYMQEYVRIYLPH